MKKKPFNPLLLGAVLLGLVAFYLIYNQFQKIESDNKRGIEEAYNRAKSEFEKTRTGEVVVVNKEKTRPVVYAKIQIKAGDKIEAPMLEVKETPEKLLLAAFQDPSEVVGQYAVSGMEVGQPVMPSSVSRSTLRLSVRLTPGMRAISLPVQNINNVTGSFVTDGDLVDLLLTYQAGKAGETGMSRTVIVLQNVHVLYAPGPDDYRSEQTRPVKARPGGEMVTFEVTPDQAEMLVQLSQMGTYRLILRNRDDKVQWRTKGFSTSEFYDDDAAAQRRSNRSLQTASDIAKEIKQSVEQAGGGNPNAK